jgi:murein lipoprotein
MYDCVATQMGPTPDWASPRQHFGLSDTNELTLGEYFMTLTTSLKASLAVACVVAFAGCTDLKPIQAQIDDLKSQVSKLQSDTAKAASDAAAANSAAAAAQSAASGAQSTANQALSTAQSNSTAIEAINEKIDRMFKKSVSK